MIPRRLTDLFRLSIAFLIGSFCSYLIYKFESNKGVSADHMIGLVGLGRLLGIVFVFSLSLYPPFLELLDLLISRFRQNPGRVTLVAILIITALTFFLTPQIEFGSTPFLRHQSGYGNDGVFYGTMSERFLPGVQEVPAPFGHRFLLPLLVNLSGMEIFFAYKIIALLSFVGSLFLIFNLTSKFSTLSAAPYIATITYSMLQFGLKWGLYYPVLMDSFGNFLLLLIIYAVIEKTNLLYLFAISLTPLTRENLLSLTLFHIIYSFRTSKSNSTRIESVLLQLLPLSIFVYFRSHPIFKIVEGPDPITILGQVEKMSYMFLTSPKDQASFAVAHFNCLGLILILSILYYKNLREFFIRHNEWAYLLLVTLILSAVGGKNYDRFSMWQAPILLIGLCYIGNKIRISSRTSSVLLMLQAVFMFVPLPWFPSKSFYRSRYSEMGPGFDWVLAASLLQFLVVLYMCHNDRKNQL